MKKKENYSKFLFCNHENTEADQYISLYENIADIN